jgi:hypothetical protein
LHYNTALNVATFFGLQGFIIMESNKEIERKTKSATFYPVDVAQKSKKTVKM